MASSRCYTGMPEMWETIGAVCGVGWSEAEAYACFVGMRLPTEAEWEKAVSWNSAE